MAPRSIRQAFQRVVAFAVAGLLLAAADAPEREVRIAPARLPGSLAGTLAEAGDDAPAILMLPGSGPIDRDELFAGGNGAGTFRLLSRSLTERGVTSLRVDKRGTFGSRAAAPDPERVSLAEKAEDALDWAAMLRSTTGRKCVWILGHSEGGIVALLAAQRPTGLCGVVLLASPGRRMTDWVRGHLRSNPAFAADLPKAEAALAAIDAGGKPDSAALPESWRNVAAGQAAYWLDMARQDPSGLAKRIRLPILIIQGDADRIVSVEDARALTMAAPRNRLLILTGVDHLLRRLGEGGSAEPEPAVPDAITDFVGARRR